MCVDDIGLEKKVEIENKLNTCYIGPKFLLMFFRADLSYLFYPVSLSRFVHSSNLNESRH